MPVSTPFQRTSLACTSCLERKGQRGFRDQGIGARLRESCNEWVCVCHVLIPAFFCVSLALCLSVHILPVFQCFLMWFLWSPHWNSFESTRIPPAAASAFCCALVSSPHSFIRPGRVAVRFAFLGCLLWCRILVSIRPSSATCQLCGPSRLFPS